MTELPKAYVQVEPSGVFIIARKKTDGLFYIFDTEGGLNKDVAFTSLERARSYVPTIDHLVRFTSPLAGVRHRPSWKKC